MATGRVSVQLFGPLRLRAGDIELGGRGLGGPKIRQVLEVLLLERGLAVSKDRIIDLLWGQTLPKNVMATLENHVSVLRRHLRALGGDPRALVVTGESSYRFASDAVDVDLDHFDDLIVASRSGTPAERRQVLEEALALECGPVLADEPYVEWALRVRDDYAERALRAYVAASEACLILGDLPAALDHAERVLARDAAREAAHRVAITALYALGHQAEALRAFDRCRRALVEELGVDPLPSTTALQAAILDHANPDDLIDRPVSTGEAGVLRSSAPAPGTLPLLGRSNELQMLLDSAELVVQSRTAALVLVEGEAGAGKTRLLDELVARKPKAVLGRARCVELERDVPYVPLADALRAALGSQLEEFSDLPGLGDILPELGPTGLPPESGRAAALNSLVTCVRTAAPMVLVIDDVQWADPSTVTALGLLRRRCHDAAVLIIGAFRGEDVNPADPVRALTEDVRVELGPLTEADLAPLGHPGLYERTGGHALFVAEIVNAGVEDQALPDTVLDAVRARCRRAGPWAHRLLSTTSVFGRPFDVTLAAGLLDEAPLTVAEALDDLCVHRLLRTHGTGFDFRHDVIRQALYTDVSPGRRLVLHRAALALLVDAGADAAQLAYHADAAGAVGAAVRHYTVAGDDARNRWAHAEAVRSYGRALALADEHSGALDGTAEGALRLHLAEGLVALGRTADADRVIEPAQLAAAARGDEQLLFAAVAARSEAAWQGSAISVALQYGRDALVVAEALGEPAALSRAHFLVGHSSGSLGHFDESEEHCRRSLAVAEAAGLMPIPLAIGRLAVNRHLRGEPLGALAWCQQAEDAAVSAHDEGALVFARWVTALIHLDLGHHQLAWETLVAIEGIGLGEEVPFRSRVPNTYGAILADLAIFDEALDRDLCSVELARSPAIPLRHVELEALMNVVVDHLGLGHVDEARAQLEAVRARADEGEQARFRRITKVAWLDAELALAEGDAATAHDRATAAAATAESSHMSKYAVRAALTRARALSDLGEHREAARVARATAARADRLGLATLTWQAWWAAHRASGRDEDAGHARDRVAQIAAGLDGRLRDRFLAGVPIRP